jgi:hypothetical protein
VSRGRILLVEQQVSLSLLIRDRNRQTSDFHVAPSPVAASTPITQLLSDIPSHGLNDKKMVEMTAFEEFGLLGRELGQAEDYA